MNQETALQILKTGKNVFLTGSAGVGKTYLLNKYIKYLRNRDVPLSITASTGIAATHINGRTIHSWSGIGIKDKLTASDLEKMAKKKPVRERIEKVKVLIIDEISMLSGDTLSCIDEILRFFKMSFEPFGGIQVVFSGDFFQLPPVSRERKESHEKFAFMAPIWVKTKLNICYLDKSYRHEEDKLLSILDEIRSGEISEYGAEILQEKLENSHSDSSNNKSLKLFTHNADVDQINESELDKLETTPKYFQAKTAGNKNIIESLKKSILAPDNLELKKNAQVIFVKNNYDAGYLNGTMGEIIDFNLDGFPVVETLEGNEIVAKPTEWSIVDESNVAMASFTQIPLRLAWAITVHKSQGMSLDSAEVNLSRTFEAGQGYVALSRVRSWDGLTLLGCNQQALQVDRLAMRADVRFQELSEDNNAECKKYSEEELDKLFCNHVLTCGGTLNEKKIAENCQKELVPKIVKPKVPKISTYEQTRVLIKEGKNLEEIIIARGLNKGTIINHLEKLRVDFPELDLAIFKPDAKILKLIQSAIKKCEKKTVADDFDSEGRIKLGLIHRELGGKIEYDDIKLCRIGW